MQAKRRLVYLSTINLSSNKAQSLQIKQVVNSLNNVCIEKKISFKAFSFFEVNESFQQLFEVFGNQNEWIAMRSSHSFLGSPWLPRFETVRMHFTESLNFTTELFVYFESLFFLQR